MANLKHMSPELLLLILKDACLSRRDWKSFRLASQVYEPYASSLLFRRIRISRLREDLEALESSAARPTHRTTYQEKSWGVTVPDAHEAVQEIGFTSLTQLMVDAAADPNLFWIPRHHDESSQLSQASPNGLDSECSNRTSSKRTSSLQTDFFSALDRMPNLRIFLSSPMPDRRSFLYNKYVLQADMYRLQSDSSVSHAHDGLFSYMLPAAARHESKIRSLYWADEKHYTALTARLNASVSDAFRALTSISYALAAFPFLRAVLKKSS
ncbi:Uu.00g003960.m01.CDS01 [Anthostomella pinea]|uniref:Uu.00g003960.m01.CDS01 n=1 Tax=Anthostomella pinea TaxID=933095 RepID=A0AAI8VKU2_9PEZI|nr:Uu.00g003960.m01.CDS01 [Anthostomella pinea]